MTEAINEREKTRAACIELMEATLLDKPQAGLAIGERTYTGAEVIKELQNATPLGEKLIDMYLLDQQKRSQIKRPQSFLSNIQSIVTKLVRRVL